MPAVAEVDAALLAVAYVQSFKSFTLLYAHKPLCLFSQRGGPGRGGNFSGGPPSASETGAFPVRNGVEIWRGYYTSIRPVPRGLVYNVDVTQ